MSFVLQVKEYPECTASPNVCLHTFCLAGYVVATDMDAKLVVTLPNAISGIEGISVSPIGAMTAGTPVLSR